MRTPAAAMVWQLFARYRWYWVAGVAYFVVVAILCQVLPESPFANAVRYCLAVELLVIPVGIFITFAIGSDGDLASRDSLYPERMFTLPVRTRTLVAWPMLLGSATMFLACLAAGQLVVRTLWPEAPLWRPTLLLTACLAWLQTLAWFPLGLRWLRVGIAVIPLVALFVMEMVAAVVDPPGVWFDVVLAAQIPLAYAVAMRGVRRARCGKVPDWQWLIEAVQVMGIRRRRRSRSFRSAQQAQAWFEWRMHGTVPVWFGVVGTFLVVFVLVFHYIHSLTGEPLLPFAHPPLLLALPLLFALMLGPVCGQFVSQFCAPTGCPSFLAIRPMDSTGFVKVKLHLALSSVLVMYAVAVPMAGVLTIALQDYGWLEHSLGHISSPTKQVAIGLLSLGLLPAAAWALIAGSLFVNLMGRKWIIVALSIVGLCLFYGLMSLGWWISSFHPEWFEVILAMGPGLLAALAVLKLALAAGVLRALCRRRLLSETAAVRLVGLWLAVAAGLLLLAAWLLPSNLFAWPVAVSCVVLAVPAVRIGLAPLALAWNRHR